MDKSGEQIPSILLYDLLLDLGYSSTIKNIVSELFEPRTTGLTHAVNRAIASQTD